VYADREKWRFSIFDRRDDDCATHFVSPKLLEVFDMHVLDRSVCEECHAPRSRFGLRNCRSSLLLVTREIPTLVEVQTFFTPN
jgi:hypothetical protein